MSLTTTFSHVMHGKQLYSSEGEEPQLYNQCKSKYIQRDLGIVKDLLLLTTFKSYSISITVAKNNLVLISQKNRIWCIEHICRNY